jgi:hypothetical protein
MKFVVQRVTEASVTVDEKPLAMEGFQAEQNRASPAYRNQYHMETG